MLDARVYLILQAARLVGNYLYAWGGESQDEGGYDCSGYVSDALTQTAKAWPELYSGGRTTAAGLYDYFNDRGVESIERVDDLKPGCIVFYRRPAKRIHHVAIHAVTVPDVNLNGKKSPVGAVAFEAAGAGSAATSPRAALIRSAGIRLTASDKHGRDVEWIAKDPFQLLLSD